jgi:hypothetical protein
MASAAPSSHDAVVGTTELVELLTGRRCVVITGAGCSTESGIPDYRGAGRPARGSGPIQHGEFLDKPEVRLSGSSTSDRPAPIPCRFMRGSRPVWAMSSRASRRIFAPGGPARADQSRSRFDRLNPSFE